MKNKITLIQFLFFLCLFLFSNTAFSQAPEKLSYQSVIRRTNNDLVVNQNVRVKISILQGTISGMAVYVEDHTTSTNSNGLVSLSIGGGNVISGTFSAITWENGPYFVKMEADPTGGTNYTVSGTSQLLSVPYALYAKTSGSSTPGPTGAQGIQGVAGTNGTNGTNGVDGKNTVVKTTTEAAGANCATGGVKLEYGIDANNNGVLDEGEINATLTKYVCNGFLSNGTNSGNTPYWNGSTWITNSNNLFNNGANIGIGTTNPLEKLHINGNLRTSQVNSSSNLLLTAKPKSTPGAFPGQILLTSGSTYYPGGDVTINAGGPDEYYGGGIGASIIFKGFDYPSNPGEGANLLFRTGEAWGGERFFKFQKPGGSSNVMVISSSGRVGIGMDSPQTSLHVKDVLRLEPRNTAPSSPSKGDMFFDSTINKLRVYDGTTWQNCW